MATAFAQVGEEAAALGLFERTPEELLAELQEPGTSEEPGTVVSVRPCASPHHNLDVLLSSAAVAVEAGSPATEPASRGAGLVCQCPPRVLLREMELAAAESKRLPRAGRANAEKCAVGFAAAATYVYSPLNRLMVIRRHHGNTAAGGAEGSSAGQGRVGTEQKDRG